MTTSTKMKSDILAMITNRKIRFLNICNFIITCLLVCTILSASIQSAYSQASWVKDENNPIMSPGSAGSWESLGADMGSVLFDGSTYHLWYAGHSGVSSRIGHATSPDGIVWTKDTLNPVLNLGSPGDWENYRVYSPCVIFHNSLYHMWYVGNDGYNERIGHATSIDGSLWIKDSLNPVLDKGTAGSWDDTEIFPMSGSVIFDGTMFQMWYGGGSFNTGKYAIGHATSIDGSIWVKDTLNNPVMIGSSVGWDWHSVIPGTILFDGTLYQSWYSGCSSDYRWRVGYATSADGINWIPDIQNNPVLDFGEAGSWDNQMAWDACVKFDSLEYIYKMWYSGGSFYTGQIGFAADTLSGVGIPDDNLRMESQMRSELTIYPNPASDLLQFTIPRADQARMVIYNVQRQLVAENDHILHKHELNINHFTNGMYFVYIITDEEIHIKKLIKN